MEKIISVVTKRDSHLDNSIKVTNSNFHVFEKQVDDLFGGGYEIKKLLGLKTDKVDRSMVSHVAVVKDVPVTFKPKSKIHLRKKIEVLLSSSSNRARPVTAMSLGFADSLNKLPRH